MSEEILSELQLLTSMYDPSDIHFDDPEITLMIENSIPITGSVSLTLKLNEFLEVHIRIPTGYPDREKISAHIRLKKVKDNNNLLLETEANTLNEDLILVIKNGLNEDSACDILSVINWCNNRWETISVDSKSWADSQEADIASSSINESKTLCRIWIHSHHIYNEKKRKFLIETASKLDLSGFSLPGKPGFVCVQGDPKNCDDFWSQVRQLTWQKISLIERQIIDSSDDTAEAFSNSFEELLIDKSTFMKYLEERKISNVIKDYLGF